ncbi:MAG TPA: amidohydrolase family protein [Acidimicrobiia bacterium]|nr:amidohydrolase family protein [Acidimicrobiia bacterium]
MHDLVIRSGTVIDGLGGPAFAADVAVDDGVITAVGTVDERGREEIDADGLTVTPGFVDVHTHYDGQATWDPLITPSIWHGVTTVVMGNCGVGFAPAAPDRRDWLIGLMEGVEGIPGPSLREGIQWDWESVPEYLDALDRIPRAIDIAAQIPHGALRAYVMDERSAWDETASDDDIARMAKIVEEGVAAGAVGLSVNRLELHKDVDGREVPGTFADDEEVFELIRGAAAGSRDAVFTTILSQRAGADPGYWDAQIDWMSRLSRETGIVMTLPFGGSADGTWRDRLARIERENAAGARIVPQVSSHRQGLLCGLRTLHPFMHSATYQSLAHLPVAEQARRMAEPEMKRTIMAEAPVSKIPRLHELMLAHPDGVFPSQRLPDHEPDPSTSLAAQAQALGRDPEDLLYDWTIGEDGEALVHYFLGGGGNNLDHSLELLPHPATVLGLGDGGAHVNLVCDVGYPSFLLWYWVRERERGRIPVETAIRVLSSEPARMYGFRDRGAVAEGLKADLNVLDIDAVKPHELEIVHDLPAGATRIIQHADGYVATIVRGKVVQRDGADTGARPGRVVRGGR